MNKNTANKLSANEAAGLTYEICAQRPEWRPIYVMATLSRAHKKFDRDQIQTLARAAALNLDVADLAAAFELHQPPVATKTPAAATNHHEPVRKTLEDLQRQSIARALPNCYDDLSPELIAEDQFNAGIRKLYIHDEDGGPTYALRLLIDELRSGLANADDLDTALNVLEIRLCIPLTTADDGA